MIDTKAVRALADNWDHDEREFMRELVDALRQCADEIDKGRALERERCAKLLESLAPAGTDSVLLAAAKEIRALCTYPLCQCNEPTDNCGRTK